MLTEMVHFNTMKNVSVFIQPRSAPLVTKIILDTALSEFIYSNYNIHSPNHAEAWSHHSHNLAPTPFTYEEMLCSLYSWPTPTESICNRYYLFQVKEIHKITQNDTIVFEHRLLDLEKTSVNSDEKLHQIINSSKILQSKRLLIVSCSGHFRCYHDITPSVYIVTSTAPSRYIWSAVNGQYGHDYSGVRNSADGIKSFTGSIARECNRLIPPNTMLIHFKWYDFEILPN